MLYGSVRNQRGKKSVSCLLSAGYQNLCKFLPFGCAKEDATTSSFALHVFQSMNWLTLPIVGSVQPPPGACSKCILPISSPFRSLFEQSRRRPGRSGQFNMSQRPIKRRRTKLKKKPKWNKAFFPVWTPQDWEHLVNCLKNPPSFQGIVLEVPSGSNPTDPRPLQHMLDPQQLIKNLLDLIHTKVME